MRQPTVLVVEDDQSLCEALCDVLELSGYAVSAAGDGEAALRLLDSEHIGAVVTDVQMRPMDGHTLLKRIKGRRPDLPVVLMTAYGTIQQAVAAMRDGAADYLVKPFEAEVLVHMVSRFVDRAGGAGDEAFIAVDPRSQALVELAARIAESDATVTISGDSGSGKEVLARFIHRRSRRARGPFVAINCAAIPEHMLEAVLFGYEKGAFTGAYQARPGKFEQADGGTLLLDEIGEMDLGLQAKLLRVLQEREVERLGASRSLRLDVRVLATTNRDLSQAVAAGRFREDLYYRLQVVPLHLPPLRERPGDILPLARSLLARHSAPGLPPGLTVAAELRLLAHDWPGNVRELDNALQRALIFGAGRDIDSGALDLEGLLSGAAHRAAVDPLAVPEQSVGRLGEDLRSREEALILDALRSGNGSRKAAAERLGISPRTLRYKLARLREAGVSVPP